MNPPLDMPDRKALKQLCQQFTTEWNYFFQRINWNTTLLDPRSFTFIHTIPPKLATLAKTL